MFTALPPAVHKNHYMWVSAAMRDTIRSGTEGDKAWLKSPSTKKLWPGTRTTMPSDWVALRARGEAARAGGAAYAV